jgi:hypothetical protein
MLLPPDLRDWLSDDHLAWFVIDAVTELDLEPFYASYRSGGHGAATHDPKIPAEEQLAAPSRASQTATPTTAPATLTATGVPPIGKSPMVVGPP